MAIVPLYGHQEVRARLSASVARKSLPSALLFQGPRGIGKQRLALWLAQALLCESPEPPCDRCRGCQFTRALTHPDLHWFFPRPRLKDADDLAKVKTDYAEAIAERAGTDGLYPSPSGMDAIYFDVVRLIVQTAVLSPAIARRKVFIIGDAERMVSQEGKEEGANAFLKLLEEPPADTTFILTSSEPGALLPTIRSRVVVTRISPLDDDAMRQFLANPQVRKQLGESGDGPKGDADRIEIAQGMPGRLLSDANWAEARESAQRMLDSIAGKPSARLEAAWTTASSKARGGFADTLDALTTLLHARARDSASRGEERRALAATRAIELVEVAKERIETNVSPQLITVNLLRDLQELFA
jgi:DNA polymerase-3 subunit delta'